MLIFVTPFPRKNKNPEANGNRPGTKLQAPPGTGRNVTGTNTSGHKRDFEVTLIVPPADMRLLEKVPFLLLIDSINSATVPHPALRRSLRKVVSEKNK